MIYTRFFFFINSSLLSVKFTNKHTSCEYASRHFRQGRGLRYDVSRATQTLTNIAIVSCAFSTVSTYFSFQAEVVVRCTA
jgi:hypothetical protein